MNKKIIIAAIICLNIFTIRAYSIPKYIDYNKIYAKFSASRVLSKKFRLKCDSCVYAGTAKNSHSVSGALGYDIHRNIAVEILGRFSPLKWKHVYEHTVTSQKMNSYSVFANIYFKHMFTNNIIPYFTLGSGYTFNRSKTMYATQQGLPLGVSSSGRSINSLIWNIGIGSSFKLTDNFLIDIGYRYMHLGKIGFKHGNTKVAETNRVNIHDIAVGLIYKI